VVGELIAERYELEQLIGSGGMSSVFRARDRFLDRTVALKILHEHRTADPDAVERFRREARAVAQLSHPNIVTVIDRGESGGREFIVFEHVEGEDLKRLVERVGPLPVRRALEIAIEAGRGLAFAHEHGLVHRDVKPQNLLLVDGRVKVTDFGIARAVEGEGITLTGTVLGTSDYISPEQASGEPADPRSDVYSLGAVFYELLTGEVPFPAESAVAVALRHLNDPPPSAAERRPDVPLRVDAAIRLAMAKDPGERFPTMGAFVAELRACLAHLGSEDAEATAIMRPPASAPARPAPARARRRRGRLLVLLAAAGALTAAVAVVLLERGGNGPGPAAGPARLTAVAAYDPDGDGREHDEAVAEATDGDPTSYWRTERYRDDRFGNLKPGVGLVVDAGRPAVLGQLVVTTDTPGFTAEVRAGASPAGPFRTVSEQQAVDERTTFALDGGEARRYYLLWITRLPPGGRQAHVNEVTAR